MCKNFKAKYAALQRALLRSCSGLRVNHSFRPRAQSDWHRICSRITTGRCSHFNQGSPRAGAKDNAWPTSGATPFDAKADAMTRLMKILHLAALTAASALVLATTTEAQTPRNCAPRDHVVLRLADGYGETRQSMGLAIMLWLRFLPLTRPAVGRSRSPAPMGSPVWSRRGRDLKNWPKGCRQRAMTPDNTII